MGKTKLNLSWNDRFALMDFYKPTDQRACEVFGVTADELTTARALKDAGTFSSSKTCDVRKYGKIFNTVPLLVTKEGGSTMTTTKTPTATTHVAVEKPETATKPAKVLKKRGRKGDKILKALTAVPAAQVPVDQFIQQHNVSLAVLRQAKRFIETLEPSQAQQIGRINVRQDKATKKLMIWREDI